MNVTELVEKINASTSEWLQALQNIPDEAFNRLEENRWSPGQLLMHMFLVERGVVGILTGPSEAPNATRADLRERIERGLTNYDRKIVAPGALEPRRERYDKNALTQKFVKTRHALVEILLNSPELDNVFTSYPHPYFGLLTGFEWAYNIWHHANRHLKQLERILDADAAQRLGG